ncbi:hypothetical protein FQA39_LY02446 [Lamprigera yunnana]|nr:hypothetical protein FQA39_LY02446 [Lamprigera yunnana]
MENFCLKTAGSLLPLMNGTEDVTMRLIDSIELYDTSLDENVRLQSTYNQCSELIADSKQHFIVQKSAAALSVQLNNSRPDNKTVNDFGKTVEELLTELTIAQSDEKVDSYRLPKNVKPISYYIKLEPNFQEKTFKGTVSIAIDVLENSTSITLHSYKLTMPSKDKIIVKEADTNYELNTVFAGPVASINHQFFKIQLSEILHEGGKYIITFPNFQGYLGNGTQSFSINTFKDTDGTIRNYAFSHFQPTSARKAFPCFDEPDFRSKFNLRLVRPDDTYISASNTPMIARGVYPDFEDVYEETVEMPVYLVAFTISEMRFSETFDNIRIIAQPNVLTRKKHKFALNVTSKVVALMEEFTSIPYALSKLDQVAIPVFPGGMENWGLIVYGDNYLILQNDTPRWRAIIIKLISHEVAHQWFGNLVTPIWWEYIWLSEEFATYFESLFPSKVDPNIDGRGKFSVTVTQTVFTMDLSYRSLNQKAETPIEVLMLFDSISYKKGCSVIRMLEMVLTTPIFIQGVRYYLQEKQFNSVSPADLYLNMQKSVDKSQNKVNLGGLSVADIMTTWDSLSGFPVVTIERDYNSKGLIYVTQERFTISKPKENGHWKIPINFATKSNPSFETTTPDHWITNPTQELNIFELNQNDWLIANKRQTSYYRVNYDDKNWKLITEVLFTNHIDIDVLNRAQLVDDSMNLGKSGRLDYNIVKNLTNYLSWEDDPLPWEAYNRNVKLLGANFYYSLNYNTFKKYVFRVAHPVYRRLCFQVVGDSTMQKELSKIIINLLCRLDHSECLYKTSEAFKKWRKGEKISSHLRSAVFCGAIRNGNQQHFEFLFQLLNNGNNDDMDIIEGLACSKNFKNLNRLLKMNMYKSIDEIISTVAESGPEGLSAAVKFISKNIKTIEKQLQGRFAFFLQKLGLLISNEHHLQAIKGAIARHERASLLEGMLFIANDNLKWRLSELDKLIKVLRF